MPATPAPDQSIDAHAGRKYWQDVSADVNGMLGGVPSVDGFASLSNIDLQGSRTFLARMGIGTKNGRKSAVNTLEGGAGIGRITEGLLLHVSETVDVIEPIPKFTERLQSRDGVRHVFNVGLEEWQPAEDAKYDLIWVQWCAGHVTDDQLVRFLQAAKTTLRSESSVIVFKENITSDGKTVFDAEDSTVSRGDENFQSVFKEAGLRIIRSELQRGIPETAKMRLLPVKMYALKP